MLRNRFKRKFKTLLFAAAALLVAIVGGSVASLFAPSGRETAEAAGSQDIKVQLTALKFVNDTGVVIDNWSFKSVNIPGNKNTLTNSKIDPAGTGDYVAENRSFSASSFTKLYFKANPQTIAENRDTSTVKWYWDYKDDPTPQGPYKIETTIHALSVNGKLYLPFGAINSNVPNFFVGSDLIEVSVDKPVLASQIFDGKHGGDPKKTTSVFLPIDDDGWLKWDEDGRAYFSAHNLGICYITVDASGKVGVTDKKENAEPIKPSKTAISEEIEKTLEDYKNDSPSKTIDTFRGVGTNTCPIETETEYWTAEVVAPEGSTAGEYCATITPKEDYTWFDGSTDAKTVYWNVAKGKQALSFGYDDAENPLALQESGQIVPFTVGDAALVNESARLRFKIVQENGEAFPEGQEPVFVEAVGFGGEGEPGLKITRNTQNRTSAKVTVTVPGNGDLEDEEFTFLVNLDAGEGFYLDGAGDIVYPSLADALTAARAAGTEDVKIHVRGRAELDAAAELPANLTLIGDEGSEIVATTAPVFEVGTGKKLTLQGVTIKENAAGAAIKVSGGALEAAQETPTIFEGGGIEVASGTVALSGVNFADGGVAVESGTVDLEGVTFAGGGLEVAGGEVKLGGTVVFSDCKKESGNGGAMNLTGGAVTLDENAVVSIGGSTAQDGGAIFVGEGATLDAAAGALSVADGDAKGKGGAIFVGNGSKVTLGENVSIGNNAAATGNGVYVEDGAKLTLAAVGAAGIADGIMLGHTESQTGNASLDLTGGALEDGKTIVVEFENAEAQTADAAAQYVTSQNGLTADQLKSFMRVKNAGYTFKPEGDGLLLGATAENFAAYYNENTKTWTPVKSLQEAIDGARGIAPKPNDPVMIALYRYHNVTPGAESQNGGDLELSEPLVIPAGLNVELCSVTATVSEEGGTPEYATEVGPFTLKRANSLTEEMIRVEAGASLTVGNVILDGGAVWSSDGKYDDYASFGSGPVKVKDDGKGGAGTLLNNNEGAKAHAPVIVNRGSLTIGEGATIQNNDNNYALPGQGFGSENYGGGVRNEGAGKLAMTGGTIKNCYSREGGAIMNVNKPGSKYEEGDGPSVLVSGGTISGNVSQTKGAAIQNVYGNANATVSGGATIQDNFSLRNLGVLTVEEGASLTVSGGTVAAVSGQDFEGKDQIAIYLYNQYGQEAVEGSTAGAKPFVENKKAGELTIVSSPAITGKVHLDDPCVAYKEGETGTVYDPYLNLKTETAEYSGDGLTLDANPDRPSGSLAKGSKEALEKLAGCENAASEDGLRGTYYYRQTEDGAFTLRSVAYRLAVSQEKPGELVFEGFDEAVAAMSVTIGGEEKQLTKKGDAFVLECADASVKIEAVTFAYGAAGAEEKVTLNAVEGGEKELPVVLFDAETLQLTVPADAEYVAEDGSRKGFNAAGFADGTGMLPNDVKVEDGKITVIVADETRTIEIGARGKAVGEKTGDAAITAVKEGDSGTYDLTIAGETGLEYNLLKDGEFALDAWALCEDGTVTFSGLAADGAEYTVVARTPAEKSGAEVTTLAGAYAVQGTLAAPSAEETAALKEYLSAYEAVKNGLWSSDGTAPQTPAAAQAIGEAIDKYAALSEAMKGLDEVKSGYPALERSYAKALAAEWRTQNANVLKAAESGTMTIPSDSGELETLKSNLIRAIDGFNAMAAKDVMAAVEAIEEYSNLLNAYKKGIAPAIDAMAEEWFQTNSDENRAEYEGAIAYFKEQVEYFDLNPSADGGTEATEAIRKAIDQLSQLIDRTGAALEIQRAYNEIEKEFGAKISPLKREELSAELLKRQQDVQEKEALTGQEEEEAREAFAKIAAQGAAERLYLDAYLAVTGKEAETTVEENGKVVYKDPTVKGVAEQIAAASDATGANAAAEQGIEALIAAFGAEDGAAKAYLDGALSGKTTIEEKVAALKNAKAVAEYLKAYRNVCGKDALLTDAGVEEAIRKIVEAKPYEIGGGQSNEIESANRALAEAVKELLEEACGTSETLKAAAIEAVETAEIEGNRVDEEGTENGKFAQNIAEIGDAVAVVKNKLDAEKEFGETMKVLTGKDATAAELATFAESLKDADSKDKANDALGAALKEAVKALEAEGDSAEAKALVAAAQKAIDDAVAAANAAAEISVPDLSENATVKGLLAALAAKRGEEKTAAKGALDALGTDAAAQALPQALKDVLSGLIDEAKAQVEGGSFAEYDDIQDKLEKKRDLLSFYAEKYEGENNGLKNDETVTEALEAGLDAIEKAETDRAKELNKGKLAVEKEYSKQALKESTDKDNKYVKDVVADAAEAIDGVTTDGTDADATAKLEAVEGIVDATAPKIAGERFLGDDGAVTRKQFSSVEAADRDALAEAQKSFEKLEKATKDYLDGKYKAEPFGYESYAGELQDRANKAAFEQKKDEAVAKAESLLKECDGEYVQGVNRGKVKEIEDLSYVQQKTAEARSAYATDRDNAVKAASNDAEKYTLHAQETQRTVNAARKTQEELAASGRYNDAQKAELQAVVDELEGKAQKIEPSATSSKELSDLLDAAQGALADVRVTTLTAGEINPDKTPSQEGGTGDYGEGYEGELWGIVSSTASMESDAQLSIGGGTDRSKETSAAIKAKKVNPAAGSGIEASNASALVEGKTERGSINVLLKKDGETLGDYSGSYTVKVLMPEDVRGETGHQVVRLCADGGIEVLKTSVEDGKYLVFTTDALGEFQILTDGDALNLVWLIVLLSALILIELILLVVLLLTKRGGKKDEGGSQKTAAIAPLPLLLAATIPAGAYGVCLALGITAIALFAALAVLFLLKRRPAKAERGASASEAEKKNEKTESSKEA